MLHLVLDRRYTSPFLKQKVHIALTFLLGLI